MSSPGKWFTCTPIRFKGGQAFFARDSGLLCKGFQEIGIECKAILPGPPVEDEQVEDLIRTEYENLENPDWWRSLGGEGVVFYGWGSGKYSKVARAIREADLFLLTHLDTGGMLGVLNGFLAYTEHLWRWSFGIRKPGPISIARFGIRLAYGVSAALIKNDLGRARHLKQADIIGATSPAAAERIRKVCRIYGGSELESRVMMIPHPIAPYMLYDPLQRKEPLIVTVGYWPDPDKDSELLMHTVTALLTREKDVTIEIYGRPTDEMVKWSQDFDSMDRDRIKIMGVVPNEKLRHAFQRAQISLCTSLMESFHIASGEALCSGCSIVGPDTPGLPSMKWFADGPFGTLATRKQSEFADALASELGKWRNGERNPLEISDHWSKLLHAPRVAEMILKIASLHRSHKVP